MSTASEATPAPSEDGAGTDQLGSIRLRSLLGGDTLVPLAVLFGLNAVDELDRVAFGVLLPEIRDAFGLDNSGILGVVGIVAAISLLLQPFVGFWTDRRRRVPIAMGGAATWAVFSLATGLAPTVVILLMARIGSSVGRMVNDPTHQSLLSDYYPPRTRVRAFYFHRMANNLGQFAGPIIAGALAVAFGWRLPFLVFAFPTVLVIIFGATRLKEPVRGLHERSAAGADADLATVEDDPVSFAEAWRTAHNVRTLRRLFYSMPWFGASLTGIGGLYSLYYEEIFGLNELSRGVLATVGEVPQFGGALVGATIGSRVAQRNPGLLLRALAVAGIVISSGFLVVAIAPVLGVAVAGNMLASGSGAMITAGLFVSISFVIPPRIRGVGFGIGAVYAAPGVVVILPVVGAIADGVGIRWGIAFMIPIFLIGAFTLASAGSFVAADMERIQATSLAQSELKQSREAGEAKLLVVRDLDVSYGSTQVLFGVDFEVGDGEIVALLGTNGAGKSTLLAAISGLVEPGAGAIVFDGKDITIKPANETVGEGVVMVPGGKGVFPTLTVRENLALAGWLFAQESEHVEAATEQVLEYFPILRTRWHEKAGNLSGGEQQMLTLGQAFIARPKLLMIDELSLGLAPLIVEQLLGIVEAIHDQGTSIVLVEQSVNVAITVAERAVFMEKGEVRFDGPTAELLERPDVLRAVFLQGVAAGGSAGSSNGHTAAPAVAPPPAVPRAVMNGSDEDTTRLETRSLSVSFGGITAANDVDLELRSGEILGLIGPNGAGKTTIMDLVSGFLVPTSGRVFLDGHDVTEMSPDRRAVLGLGRSFQDARMFPALTVAENLAIGLERHIRTRDPVAAALMSPATRIAESEVSDRVDELIDTMNLQAFANKFVSELSTGTRRVVDLACSLGHGPSVLLLDEPSSGIAQRETEALAPVLLNIRDRTGASLLVIEHDMPLLRAISDRMVALELGSVIAEGRPDEVIAHPRVIESYLGDSDAVINRSGSSRTPASPAPRRRVPLVASAAGDEQ